MFSLSNLLFMVLTEGKAVASISPEHVQLQIIVRRQHSLQINISSWSNIVSKNEKIQKAEKFHRYFLSILIESDIFSSYEIKVKSLLFI